MKVPVLVLLAASLLIPVHAQAAEFVVTMVGTEYQPARITAAVGDIIRFVNDDSTDHNVFVPNVGHAVDLGKQEPGSEVLLTLGKAGRFEVECVFHSNMLTAVEVK